MGSDPEETDDERGLAGRGVDPLDALLDITASVEDITKTVDVPILPDKKGVAKVIPWTLRVLDDDTVDELRDRATKTVKTGRNSRERQTDMKKFSALLVATATVDPNLDEPKLRGKFGSMESYKLLRKLILPGTITKLADTVMELSGYDDDELVAEGEG